MTEVTGVTPLDGYWLRLTLSNGDVIERDVTELLRGHVFDPVRQHREVFEGAFVDGGTVAWPGSADIAPETLIWNGSEPSSSGARPEQRLRLHAPR